MLCHDDTRPGLSPTCCSALVFSATMIPRHKTSENKKTTRIRTAHPSQHTEDNNNHKIRVKNTPRKKLSTRIQIIQALPWSRAVVFYVSSVVFTSWFSTHSWLNASISPLLNACIMLPSQALGLPSSMVRIGVASYGQRRGGVRGLFSAVQLDLERSINHRKTQTRAAIYCVQLSQLPNTWETKNTSKV